MRRMCRCASVLSFLLFFGAIAPVQAAVQLPQNLSQGDRVTALRIIGLGTSSKLLTNPYPLGGYAGVEAGFSLETLPADELSHLGNGVHPAQQDVTLPKFTIGKGLYNNLDLFIQFTPYSRQDEVAQYGGMVRWGFYQASTLPVSFSILANLNSANMANQMTAQSYGADLIAGINVENLALFAGGGWIEATGVFNGGASNITDSKVQETEFVSGSHFVAGADIRLKNLFVAVQMDRYSVTVFSGKVGVRF